MPSTEPNESVKPPPRNISIEPHRSREMPAYEAFTASFVSSRHVRLEGELGNGSLGALRAALEQAFFSPGDIIVDVADLGFISTSAIALLLRFQLLAVRQHRQMQLVQLSPQVARVLDLLDLRHVLASPYSGETDTSTK
jgi:anti-anti-sigma factor